jgi:hypothetical protein
MVRGLVAVSLVFACALAAPPGEEGSPTGPRLQSCTIELEDHSGPRVLEAGALVELTLELKALRRCTETQVQPDEVAVQLTDADGRAVGTTSTWERRFEHVIVVVRFTVPATDSVRASATIEPGFGVVRWVWPVHALRTLSWTRSDRAAQGFLEHDAGRAWYGRAGFDVDASGGGRFALAPTLGGALTSATVWALSHDSAIAWTTAGVRRSAVPTSGLPSALATVGDELVVADQHHLAFARPDGGRWQYVNPLPFDPARVEALEVTRTRARLCRGGRIDELVFPSTWSRSTEGVSPGATCGRTDDGLWVVEPDAVTLVPPDGQRRRVLRPEGLPVASSLLLPSRGPLLFVGSTVRNTNVAWVPLAPGDGGLEGQWVELPPQHLATGFDGRRLFINDPAGKLAWADVD